MKRTILWTILLGIVFLFSGAAFCDPTIEELTNQFKEAKAGGIALKEPSTKENSAEDLSSFFGDTWSFSVTINSVTHTYNIKFESEYYVGDGENFVLGFNQYGNTCFLGFTESINKYLLYSTLNGESQSCFFTTDGDTASGTYYHNSDFSVGYTTWGEKLLEGSTTSCPTPEMNRAGIVEVTIDEPNNVTKTYVLRKIVNGSREIFIVLSSEEQ